MIVLDTNVLSELAKPEPAASVLRWPAGRRRAVLCTTAVGEAAVAYDRPPAGRRREALIRAMARLLGEGVGGRVLPFDRAAAAAYGEIAAVRRPAGRPIATADGQMAAIARSQEATLVAIRGLSGLGGCGVCSADPWTG